MNLDMNEIQEAIDDNLGYCTNCDDIVDIFCEPDAEKYQCPECGAFSVMGIENAILVGYIS